MLVINKLTKYVFNLNGIKLSRRLTTENVELSYEKFDNTKTCERPPIVILHGLLDTKESWSELGQELCLKTNRTVINVEARNHGCSGHSPIHDYRVLSSDVIKFLDKLKLEKVSLLGHSMGGKTAMVVALLYPERISSLLVIDISPVTMISFQNNGFNKLVEAMRSIDFSGISSVSEAVEHAKIKLLERGMKQIGIVTRNIAVKPDMTIGWKMNLKVLDDSFPKLTLFPYLPGRVYPGPTLFVGASKTAFLNPEDLSHIWNQFPKTKLRYVRGVGHNIHEEDATTLMKYASNFYREH